MKNDRLKILANVAACAFVLLAPLLTHAQKIIVSSNAGTIQVEGDSAVFQRMEGDTSKQTTIVDIINLSSEKKFLRCSIEPLELQSFIKVERSGYLDSTRFESIPSGENNTIKAKSLRKLRINYLGNYDQSENMNGHIILSNDQDSIWYSIVLKAYRTNAEIALVKNKEVLENEIAEIDKLNMDLQEELHFYKNERFWQWVFAIAFAMVSTMIITDLVWRKRQKKQRKRKGKNSRREQHELEEANISKLEDINRSLVEELEENKAKHLELEQELTNSKHDHKEIRNSHHNLKEAYAAKENEASTLKNELEKYQQDTLVNTVLGLLRPEHGLDREQVMAWLHTGKKEHDKKVKEKDAPIHRSRVIVEDAARKYYLVKKLIDQCHEVYVKTADQFNGSDNLVFVKLLNESFQKALKFYSEELGFYETYVTTQDLPEFSQIRKVFKVGGLKQTEKGALANLAQYVKSEFYPLLSRSIIFMKEIHLLLSHRSNMTREAEDLSSKITGTILQINQILNIQMRDVSLLSSFRDTYKKFCVRANVEDLARFDYEGRQSFYDTTTVTSGSVKAILYIGYNEPGSVISDEQRTKILFAN